MAGNLDWVSLGSSPLRYLLLFYASLGFELFEFCKFIRKLLVWYFFYRTLCNVGFLALKNWLILVQGCIRICGETSACAKIPRVCQYLQGFIPLTTVLPETYKLGT